MNNGKTCSALDRWIGQKVNCQYGEGVVVGYRNKVNRLVVILFDNKRGGTGRNYNWIVLDHETEIIRCNWSLIPKGVTFSSCCMEPKHCTDLGKLSFGDAPWG